MAPAPPGRLQVVLKEERKQEIPLEQAKCLSAGACHTCKLLGCNADLRGLHLPWRPLWSLQLRRSRRPW